MRSALYEGWFNVVFKPFLPTTYLEGLYLLHFYMGIHVSNRECLRNFVSVGICTYNMCLVPIYEV